MSKPFWSEPPALPLALAQQVDAVCVRFEVAWKSGGRPRIEDYLGGASEPAWSALLHELILLEAEYRRRAGENPQTGDYQQRFPALDPDWLLQALAPPVDPTATAPVVPGPAVVPTAASSPPAQRLRCPHCHNPIQLQDDRPDEVLCPACGSSFQVRDARQTTTTTGMRPLGKFQLLQRVGVGAFGAVWKARDTELDRIVALKIPHAGLLTEKDELERFYREARAAAQLRHPGIVTVHEVQVLDGLPTIVADFVEGAPLKDLLQTRPLTFRETATLIAEVAEALDYAHNMGLVHRDIKPANIMLDYSQPPGTPDRSAPAATPGPERAVGRPLIMDFGLALRSDAEVTLTLEGQIIGTPAYMSPEQAAGKGHQVDRRSDIYSLGVILYEMLGGELPFRGAKAMLLVQVLREEPRLLRRLNDKIPRDLETICHKALAKEPSRRYATAQALADDLRRWLNGEPIQARPAGAWERTWRWARRRPAVAALLLMSSVAALALVGAGIAFIYNTRLKESYAQLAKFSQATDQARQDADAQRQRAEAAKEQVDTVLKEKARLQYFHHIALAHAGWRDGHLFGVERLLQECPPAYRNWEWHYLQRLCHADLLTLEGHPDEVRRVAFSPDGTRLAAVGFDQTVRVWDTTTGQLLQPLKGHTDWVRGVAFSPDGKRLASGSRDNTVKVWDAQTGQEILPLKGHPAEVWSVDFSPDGTLLLSGSTDGTVKVWDTATWQEIRTLKEHGGTTVHMSPDGTQLATAGLHPTVKVRNVATGEVLHTLKGHLLAAWGVAFSPDGTRLASASGDKTVKIWDATLDPEGSSLIGHGDHVRGVSFSPDGTQLASASSDGTVKVWDATTRQPLRTFIGHTQQFHSVTFSPDGRRLAAASKDGTVRVWDLATGQEALRLPAFVGQANSIAFSPDGRWLAFPDKQNRVAVWDMRTNQFARTFTDHEDAVNGVAFSPDGRWLASASSDNSVRLRDMTGSQEPRQLLGHTRPVRTVAFSPDGTRLASGSWDGTAILWDVTTGERLRTLSGHSSDVLGVTFNQDGTRLATASNDATVKIWDTTHGELVLTLTAHRTCVVSVAFSPDGTRLASASEDHTVQIWDARPWTPEASVEREALGLLEFLFRKPLRKADVLAHLHDSPTIRPQARQLALTLLDRYREEIDPEKYHQASWAIIRQPYLNAFQYRFALRQAETACRLAPQQDKYQTTLGVAQYRLRQYPAAMETLARADKLQATPAAGSSPDTLAFLAMAQYQFGHKEQAQTTLARLQKTLTQPQWVSNPECAAFLREAETLLQDPAIPAKP